VNTPRPYSAFARGSLLLLGLILLSATSFAQNVNGFILGKIQNFQQTGTAAPVVNLAQPFQFGALITMGTATINSATATFTGTSSPRAFTANANGNFSILDTFTTQAQLDAAYGSGNYSLSINTSAGTFGRSIFLFPFSYPTTPQLTVPASNWQSGVLVIDPAVDYNFTWNSFANAQTNDVIEIIVSNGQMFGPFPAAQTSFNLVAGTLPPGSDLSCSLAFLRVAGVATGDTNIGTGYATLAKETSFMLHTVAPALAFTAAVSRKTHGAAGTFDVNLPTSGPPGVECRSGGASGDQAIVLTFSNPVVSGNAMVTGGTGSVAGSPVFSANTMTVNLTSVANAQVLTLSVSNVTDSFGQTLPSAVISIGLLAGDTNGDGTVNSADIGQTKSQSGNAVTASNFRQDVNLDGSINSSDIGLVKSKSGTALP
jgi:hypothetical protein